MSDDNGGRSDTRVVYGVRCTYWGSIYSVAIQKIPGEAIGGGLPVCPHCRFPLFEIDNEEDWLNSADTHEAAGHEGYKDMIVWAKERPCFKSLDALAAAYEADTGKHANL
jgi:hypothetical protein